MEKSLNLSGYKCPAIINKAQGAPIIFLHGLSYTSKVWEKIGLTEALTQKNLPFLALDMPYGLKSQCQPKTSQVEDNLAVANQAVKRLFGSAAPILVGASLGGYMALRYAARFPVKGLLVVAPARALDGELTQAYSRFTFPVRIIWGSLDSLISGENMRILAGKLPNAKLLVYKDCAHSAYQDQPQRFIRDVLDLYAWAEQG